jgi:hypothetical protein
MSVIAERIDQGLRRLPAEKAASLEPVIMHLIEMAETWESAKDKTTAVSDYRLPTFSMGVNAEVDMRKLGQLPDEF